MSSPCPYICNNKTEYGYCKTTGCIHKGVWYLQTKHGRWLKTGQSFVCPDKFRNYFCSVCGFELDTHIRQEPNYCPNCGSKMDLDEVEEQKNFIDLGNGFSITANGMDGGENDNNTECE